MNSKIIACIFDMDGLLIDSEGLWAEMTSELLRECGKAYTDEMMHATLGMREAEIVPLLKNKFALTESVDSLIKERERRMMEMYRRGLKPMTGARQLLKDLESKELALAVASSSPLTLIRLALTATDLIRHFSVVVSAEDVLRGKPAPDPYLVAAERLGVAPKNCLVFEDAPNGVAAAKAAGMRVVAVPHAHSPAENLQEADLVIKSLVDFKIEELSIEH